MALALLARKRESSPKKKEGVLVRGLGSRPEPRGLWGMVCSRYNVQLWLEAQLRPGTLAKQPCLWNRGWLCECKSNSVDLGSCVLRGTLLPAWSSEAERTAFQPDRTSSQQ